MFVNWGVFGNETKCNDYGQLWEKMGDCGEILGDAA